MRSYHLFPALAVVGVLMVPSPSQAQDDDLKKLLDRLNSGRMDDQKDVINSILVQRDLTIKALIRYVQDHADNRRTHDDIFLTRKVMELLGKIRAVEAVPVLVENLTFSLARQPGSAAGPLPSLEGNRPAVVALIRIGVSSLDPVVERVASSEEMFVDRCGALVVDGVLGPRLAPVYLKDCIEREKAPKRRERLERLLHLTEEIGRNQKREVIK